MIRLTTLFIAVLTLGIFSTSRAQNDAPAAGDLATFYKVADSLVVSPPFENTLEIKKVKKIDRNYVHFIGRKGSDVIFMVAITLQPIKDVSKEIATTILFDGLRPMVGKVTSWGYIYDRNNDGKIDYMMLLAGAGPVEPNDFPDDFPPRGVQLDAKQTEMFANNAKLVFNHWADDNYDGKLDGVIHLDMDPFRDWVNRRLVIQSTKFNGLYDDVWAFRGTIDNRQDTIAHTKNNVPYQPLKGPTAAITPKLFAQQDNILALINRAIKLSGINIFQIEHTANER